MLNRGRVAYELLVEAFLDDVVSASQFARLFGRIWGRVDPGGGSLGDRLHRLFWAIEDCDLDVDSGELKAAVRDIWNS